MYINKNNLILSLIFTFIACVLIIDLFNNLDKIVQLKLNEMFVLLMLFIASNSSIAIYFGSITQEINNESIASRVL
jgi:hypothetical protein